MYTNVLSHVTNFASNFFARSAHMTLGKLNSKFTECHMGWTR